MIPIRGLRAPVLPPAPPAPRPGSAGGRGHRRWSDEDNRRFGKAWEAGHSADQMAASFSTNRGAIYARARLLGLPRRRGQKEVSDG